MHGTHRSQGIATFAALLALALSTPAWAVGGADLIAQEARPLTEVEVLNMTAVDNAALLAEDAATRSDRSLGMPLRFATALEVFQTPFTSGTWEALPDSSALWRLRVKSPGALSLNFAFTRYSMPPGGRLVIYSVSDDKAVTDLVQGPYTARHNTHGQLWTPIVLGDEAVIEVKLPATALRDLELELTAVNHGYRPFGPETPDKSGACNVDVACPEGNAWQPQIRSVAAIGVGGTIFCTGFMVNNTAEDLRPLFMTADHCGFGTSRPPASLVVYWNYENPTCRPPGSPQSGIPHTGNLNQNQTGSTLLGRSATSDYTLVELDSTPPPAYNVFWAGWDARSVEATNTLTVHHPSGHAKRISFDDQPTTTTSYLGNSVPGDGTHLRIADWDLGTTEGGSSGSPLFNQLGRVIGQLHGGFAACGNNLADWYGRLSRSWNLGLSEFLDPSRSGVTVLDGTDQNNGDDDDDDDDDGSCAADASTMCLNGGRFKVSVSFRDFQGNSGNAQVVPFGSDDSGLWWFFAADNWEMLVKVLNGCAFNNHYWVFSAATTDVEYTLRVEDTTNGQVQTYDNALGNAAPAITDTGAFATCP